MERLIATDMLFDLRNNNLITKHQHDFLSMHSTCTQLIEIINDWSIAFENRFSVDSDYLDFAKAFDTVSHHTLIFKLESYGISGDLLAWIKAFLTNRLQRVQVDNCLSSLFNVISGVPQGNVLGPILFIIYINDISDFFTGSSVTVKLYANDAKLYSCIQCADDMHFLQLGLHFVYN